MYAYRLLYFCSSRAPALPFFFLFWIVHGRPDDVSTGTAPFHSFRLFDRDGRRLFLGIPEVLVHRLPNNSNRMNLSQAMQRPKTLSGGGGGGGGGGWRGDFRFTENFSKWP